MCVCVFEWVFKQQSEDISWKGGHSGRFAWLQRELKLRVWWLKRSCKGCVRIRFRLNYLSVCVGVCVCVSDCAYTLSTWLGARHRQITSWRKHYSAAYSLQITQMFIATSATTGGGGRTFGRLASLALHLAAVSDALWQRVKRNWLNRVCPI